MDRTLASVGQIAHRRTNGHTTAEILGLSRPRYHTRLIIRRFADPFVVGSLPWRVDRRHIYRRCRRFGPIRRYLGRRRLSIPSDR